MVSGILRRGVEVIPLRHRREVSDQLIVGHTVAHDGGGRRTQFGDDGGMVDFRTSSESSKGATIERPMLAVLEVRPEIR